MPKTKHTVNQLNMSPFMCQNRRDRQVQRRWKIKDLRTRKCTGTSSELYSRRERCLWSLLGSSHVSQVFPPLCTVLPFTVDFFTSILMDWVSARDSNLSPLEIPRDPNTAFPVLRFLDIGMRVSPVRGCWASCPVWQLEKKEKETKSFFRWGK